MFSRTVPSRLTMNTLIAVIILGVIAARCVLGHVHGSGSPIWASKNSGKQSVAAAVVQSELKSWVPLGYSGPTAVPVVNSDGTIAETPEVAAARATHLAALESARSTNPDMDDGEYNPHKYGDHLYSVVPHSEGISNSMLLYNSLMKDNHVSDVNAAKAHEATNVKQTTHSQGKASVGAEAALALWKTKNSATRGYNYGAPAEQNKPYAGPLAMLQVLPTGYLADTLEVAAAKLKHLSALAEAQAASALWRAKYTRLQQQHWS